MEHLAGFIASLFRDLKLPFRWVAVGLCVFLIVSATLGFEYLTGHFYYESLEKKVSLLGELQLIANQGIDKNPELYPMYQSAVEELARCKVRNLAFLRPLSLSLGDPVALGKAISGASIWLLLLIFGVSSDVKARKLTGSTIAVATFLVVVALIFAWVGTIIPTVYNPWINYIGFPLIQLGLLYLLSRRAKKPASTGA